MDELQMQDLTVCTTTQHKYFHRTTKTCCKKEEKKIIDLDKSQKLATD